MKYKGTWLASNIFNAIRSGFTEDDNDYDFDRSDDRNSGISGASVAMICLSIFFIMIVILFICKRMINRSLEESLNDKIEKQTIFSLGQYQVFKDDNTGRKPVDIVKL